MNSKAVYGLLLTLTVLALIAIVIVFSTKSEPNVKKVKFLRVHKNFFQLALPQTPNSEISQIANEKLNFTHKFEILLPQPSFEGQIIKFPKDHLENVGFLYFGPRRSIDHPTRHCIAKFGPKTETTICKAVIVDGLLKWQITGSVGLSTKKLSTNDISYAQFVDILNALTGGLVQNVNGGSEVGVSLIALVQSQAALDSEVTEPIDPTIFCQPQSSVAPSALFSAGYQSVLTNIQTTLNSLQTTLVSSYLQTKLSVASSQQGQPSADPNLTLTLSGNPTRTTLNTLLMPYVTSLTTVLQNLQETNPQFTNNQSNQYQLGNNYFVIVFALALYLCLIQELACIDTTLVNGKYANPWQSRTLYNYLGNIWQGPQIQTVQSEALYASALMWTTIQNTYVNNYIYGFNNVSPNTYCSNITNVSPSTIPLPPGSTFNAPFPYLSGNPGQIPLAPPAGNPIVQNGVYMGIGSLGTSQTQGSQMDQAWYALNPGPSGPSNQNPMGSYSFCQPDDPQWTPVQFPGGIEQQPDVYARSYLCLQQFSSPSWLAVVDTNIINNGGPVPFQTKTQSGAAPSVWTTTNLTENGSQSIQNFSGFNSEFAGFCPNILDYISQDYQNEYNFGGPQSTITCSLPNTIHCPLQQCGAYGNNCIYDNLPDINRLTDVATFFLNPEQNYLQYLFNAGGISLNVSIQAVQGSCQVINQWQAPLPFATFAWPQPDDPSILLPLPDTPSWWTSSQVPRGTPFGYWSGTLSDYKAPLQCTSISLLDAAGTPIVNTGPQNSISETNTVCKTAPFDSVSTVVSNVSAYFNSASLAVSSSASIGCIPNTPDDQTTNLGGRIANASSVLISCFDPSVESPGVQGTPAANSRLLFCGAAEASNILSERAGITDLACDPVVSAPPASFSALFTGQGGFENGQQTYKFTTTSPLGKEIRTTSCVVKITQELNSQPQLPHTIQNLNVYANVQRNTQEGFWFLSTTNTSPFLNLVLNISTITVEYTC